MSELMGARLAVISEKMVKLNTKFDLLHKNNQELMDKIREKLDEIDVQAMEANREFDEIRRKVSTAKRHRRGRGLVRSIAHRIQHQANALLVFLGLQQKAKKSEENSAKRSLELTKTYRSENALNTHLPSSSKSPVNSKMAGPTIKLSPIKNNIKKTQ
uniref:Uncharacterized protein n=1 Tax=Caenorhabditis japonica TaxID=281687 RepID=A0A8R1EIW1_CAEJA